jgi:hypothetical protein
MSADGGKEDSSDCWEKLHSSKYDTQYWFNRVTGESSWTQPACWRDQAGTSAEAEVESSDQPAAKRRKTSAEEADTSSASVTSAAEASAAANAPVPPGGPKIAIIVPFRDLHAEQKRSEHLKRFVPEMSRYFKRAHMNIFIILKCVLIFLFLFYIIKVFERHQLCYLYSYSVG